ncbi:MAG: PilW family protein [Comamonas sp.]
MPRTRGRPPALAHPPAQRQAGLTLAELLVAMVLTTLVILAAAATLGMTRQGFLAVDAASQLRDNARFATTLLQQLAAQAGYRDLPNATDATGSSLCSGFATAETTGTALPVEGADDAIVKQGSAAFVASSYKNSGQQPVYSDLLVLRANLVKPGCDDAENDQVLLNCRGLAQNVSADASAFSAVESYLFVDHKENNAEPALYCGAYGENAGSSLQVEPLIAGVETLQVLYGVNAGDDPNNIAEGSANYQYKRAAAVTAASQWRHVRAIRIGLVLRSATPGAAENAAATYYPLGEAYASAADPGTVFVAPADGRLRQVATFTVMLRNAIKD